MELCLSLPFPDSPPPRQRDIEQIRKTAVKTKGRVITDTDDGQEMFLIVQRNCGKRTPLGSVVNLIGCGCWHSDKRVSTYGSKSA